MGKINTRFPRHCPYLCYCTGKCRETGHCPREELVYKYRRWWWEDLPDNPEPISLPDRKDWWWDLIGHKPSPVPKEVEDTTDVKIGQPSVQKGWECPKCGQVNAPFIDHCPNCKPKPKIPKPKRDEWRKIR